MKYSGAIAINLCNNDSIALISYNLINYKEYDNGSNRTRFISKKMKTTKSNSKIYLTSEFLFKQKTIFVNEINRNLIRNKIIVPYKLPPV